MRSWLRIKPSIKSQRGLYPHTSSMEFVKGQSREETPGSSFLAGGEPRGAGTVQIASIGSSGADMTSPRFSHGAVLCHDSISSIRSRVNLTRRMSAENNEMSPASFGKGDRLETRSEEMDIRTSRTGYDRNAASRSPVAASAAETQFHAGTRDMGQCRDFPHVSKAVAGPVFSWFSLNNPPVKRQFRSVGFELFHNTGALRFNQWCCLAS
jgi:hypothetical protein